MPDDPRTAPTAGEPEPDPVEAELIAYLDGELDPAVARKVEAKLAADPHLRARAAALKRTFELLDFLPKPEPSPSFTTRTLDKVPAVKSAPEARPVVPVPTATPAPRNPGVHTPGSPSLSVPVVLASSHDSRSAPLAREPAGRSWVWAFAALFAAGLALGLGYVGTAMTRAYFFPPPAKEPPPEEVPIDHRVIDNLPLYAVADDIAFVERLAAADVFGDDPAVSFEGKPATTGEKPHTGKHFDHMVKAFKALPAGRQAQIRQLDARLHDKDGNPAPLFRVLEAYAVWLDRLTDRDRKTILAAPTAEKRLDAIQDVRRTLWVATLPASQKKQLEALPPAERAALIAQWKAEEDQRQESWLTAHAMWELQRAGRQPWPFDDDARRREVAAFVKATYLPDDPKKSRLTTADRERLIEVLDRAEKFNEWIWLGKAVADFNRAEAPRNLPRYELFPEPASGKPMVTDFDQLWEKGKQHYERPGVKPRFEPKAGKWPDFALAVWEEADRVEKLGKGKPQFAVPPTFSLGPSRPTEFKDDVRKAVAAVEKMLNPTELAALKAAEGKWPEYPRDLIRLARQHDVVIPGSMPPGSPRRWEETYNPRARPGPRPPGASGGTN